MVAQGEFYTDGRVLVIVVEVFPSTGISYSMVYPLPEQAEIHYRHGIEHED